MVFFQTQGGAARETLSWEEGHCVGYGEEFEEGSSTTGSYVCHLVIAAPKLTMSPGGPPQPFVAPAPREHGTPPVAVRPAGGFGPIGFGDAKGAFSGRPYNPATCGGPIQQLFWKEAAITKNGIDLVKQHVSRFGNNPENTSMIARLEAIEQGFIESTEWDKRYYTHELREFERYRNLNIPDGQEPASAQAAYRVWNDTHTATLEDYQLADFDAAGQHNLYHPDIATAYDLNR